MNGTMALVRTHSFIHSFITHSVIRKPDLPTIPLRGFFDARFMFDDRKLRRTNVPIPGSALDSPYESLERLDLRGRSGLVSRLCCREPAPICGACGKKEPAETKYKKCSRKSKQIVFHNTNQRATNAATARRHAHTTPCARAGCSKEIYCSATCQKSAWKEHRKFCRAPDST